MYYTVADTAAIDTAIRYLASEVRTIGLTSLGLKIGAVRYFIGINNASSSATSRRTVESYRPVLAKLVHEAITAGKGAERELIVTRDIGALEALPEFARLVPKYVAVYNSRMGFGFWAHEQFEDIIFRIAGRKLGDSSTAVRVMQRSAIDALLTAYRDQAQNAASASSSAANVVSIGKSDMTMVERRQQSAEADGKCWQCDAPKPRKVSCELCGYTPGRARA